jgi:hypothetical protein
MSPNIWPSEHSHASNESPVPPIWVVNSITQLTLQQAQGQVVVAASHGGLIAGAIAASMRLRAVVFNDAGGGKEGAGMASLVPLAHMGMAACTVSRRSACIGDGEHMWEHGVVSHANAPAQACGVSRGMACRDAAQQLLDAPLPQGEPFTWTEGRHLLRSGPLQVWGCDSVTLVQPQDAHQVLVVGSHAALHAGPASALSVPAAAAFFHDAGSWGEPQGLSRLPVLAQRAVPSAAVHHQSARIGDARSMYAEGVLSFCNEPARALGWYAGLSVQGAVACLPQMREASFA